MKRLILLVLTLALLGTLPGATADAAGLPLVDVDCNGEVTKSIRLKEAVLCTLPTATGINITKSGVTLDLNGKALAGLGAADIGISVDEGVKNVTIRNGHIAGFEDFGIVAVNSDSNSGVTVKDVLVTDSEDYGISLDGPRMRVINTTVLRADGVGVELYGRSASIKRSIVDDAGIEIESPTGDAVVTDNQSFGSSAAGIDITGAKTVKGNVAVGATGAGIHINGVRRNGIVADNRAVDNTGTGISVASDVDQFRLKNNASHGNGDGGFDVPAGTPATGNVAFGNTGQQCDPVGACNAASTLPTQVITCTSSISESVALQGNVGPCSNSGPQITGKNVTVDLNGFRIQGDNAGDDTGGLVVGPSASNVTIRNGMIEKFGAAVQSGLAAPKLNVRQLLVRDISAGIFSDSPKTSVSGVVALDVARAFDLRGNGSVVSNSIAVSPASPGGVGFFLGAASETRDRMRAIGVTAVGFGSGVLGLVTRSSVIRSVAIGGGVGIALLGGTSRVTASDSHSNNCGIAVGTGEEATGPLVVKGNDAHDNVHEGIGSFGDVKTSKNRAFGNGNDECPF